MFFPLQLNGYGRFFVFMLAHIIVFSNYFSINHSTFQCWFRIRISYFNIFRDASSYELWFIRKEYHNFGWNEWRGCQFAHISILLAFCTKSNGRRPRDIFVFPRNRSNYIPTTYKYHILAFITPKKHAPDVCAESQTLLSIQTTANSTTCWWWWCKRTVVINVPPQKCGSKSHHGSLARVNGRRFLVHRRWAHKMYRRFRNRKPVFQSESARASANDLMLAAFAEPRRPSHMWHTKHTYT